MLKGRRQIFLSLFEGRDFIRVVPYVINEFMFDFTALNLVPRFQGGGLCRVPYNIQNRGDEQE